MASCFPNDQGTKVWKPKDLVEGECDEVRGKEVVAQVDWGGRYQSGYIEEGVRVWMV
jgi:hypothetical protein